MQREGVSYKKIFNILIQKKSKQKEILIGLIQKFILLIKNIKQEKKDKVIEIEFTKWNGLVKWN